MARGRSTASGEATGISEVTEVTVRGVEGLFEKVVTKFGTGAKIDCPKKYLGRAVYVVVRRGPGNAPSGAGQERTLPTPLRTISVAHDVGDVERSQPPLLMAARRGADRPARSTRYFRRTIIPSPAEARPSKMGKSRFGDEGRAEGEGSDACQRDSASLVPNS